MDKFASRTGAHYASQRNYDYGPAYRNSVSSLSPWIRHRLITEEEVLTHTLARHSPAVAMKFIQEVFWRGYFKGWLEQHPSVWHRYQSGLQDALNAVESDIHRKTDCDDAMAGRTGIACFDQWCDELKATGYLHNHARMWFASIWIFTLRLPWELGADFFLRHLIDGDPAANTLSWRWIGGLHTKGKTYLARPSNIANYTDGRFDPVGELALIAEPLTESFDHPFVSHSPPQPTPQDDFLMLVTPEDCRVENSISGTPSGVLGLVLAAEPNQSDRIHAFKKGAVEDAIARLSVGCTVTSATNWSTVIIEAAERAGVTQVVTPYAPIGPTATQLEATRDALRSVGIQLHQKQRAYDTLTWPHATKGFFKLKKKIPTILTDLGLADA
ncbi:FAD-binding domain-containing protein [Sulfitobacter sp. SK012]|uniref:FAD-binding domain-containing protein n=1 Tax=Sulfitobacter sp. SK012 TaxID=1389005 RepID=UPI0020C7ED95|nr:FAD-binding domain-containing protein [Sulfitobacter sp. SK012]